MRSKEIMFFNAAYKRKEHDFIINKLLELEKDPDNDEIVFEIYHVMEKYVLDDDFRSKLIRKLEDNDSALDYIREILNKNKNMCDPDFTGFTLTI